MAAADKDQTLKSKPVGTGPFIFEDYKPNEFFKAKKNPNYWNKPYPYLDEIEFRPIPDALNRRDALEERRRRHHPHRQRRGRSPSSVTTRTSRRRRSATTPRSATRCSTSRRSSPMGPSRRSQDQRVRCALANAWDQPTISQTDRAGRLPASPTAPSPPARPGYLEDTGFPQKQDMDKAKALIARLQGGEPGPAEHRPWRRPQDDTNLTIAQFQKQWFEEAGVDNVHDRPDRPGQLHPHRRCWGTSRSSSGATTAASTSTTSTSGGTRLQPSRWASWR